MCVAGVTRVLEPLKDQLHVEIAHKLTATDELMKDNIGKMVRSKVLHWLFILSIELFNNICMLCYVL